jgi:NifB/MoaA-like Fe-S oxidoreductase
VAAPNHTFGQSVNCSGLLGGRDILAAVEGRELGDVVVLPRYALDQDADLFIDDMTPQELEASLGRPVRYVESVTDLFSPVARAARR